MKPTVLIIDNNFESSFLFYKRVEQKYEVHLAGCSQWVVDLNGIDCSRVLLKNSRNKLEFVEQDFISACMLFIQIYVPSFIYFRGHSEMLSANSINKIIDHASLVGVAIHVNESLSNVFISHNYNFINDEDIV